MTDELIERVALAKDVGDPETVARMLRGVGIFPGTAAFVEEIPTILRALRERDQAVEALYNIRALAVKHQDYGGPNGILAAIEGFARAGLASIEGADHE